MSAMEIGITELLDNFGFAEDDEGMGATLEATNIAMVAKPQIEPRTTMETPKINLRNVGSTGNPLPMVKTSNETNI